MIYISYFVFISDLHTFQSDVISTDETSEKNSIKNPNILRALQRSLDSAFSKYHCLVSEVSLMYIFSIIDNNKGFDDGCFLMLLCYFLQFIEWIKSKILWNIENQRNFVQDVLYENVQSLIRNFETAIQKIQKNNLKVDRDAKHSVNNEEWSTKEGFENNDIASKEDEIDHDERKEGVNSVNTAFDKNTLSEITLLDNDSQNELIESLKLGK